MAENRQAQALTMDQDQMTSIMETLAECLDSFTHDASHSCKEKLHEAFTALERAKGLAAHQLERLSYLETLAATDELTGLLNRRGFTRSVEKVLANARRYDEKGVLLFIDLNGFKPVNDTYGHDAGDEVLRQVSRVLNDNVRDNDYVGRLGGDEFAVLLVRTTWDDGIDRAESLDRTLNSYYASWQGRMIGIGASIGVQVYDGKSTPSQLLKHADSAMYRAKRMRSGPQIHSQHLQG
jgi:diguanylate cyclase (GGDEF)-like protein